MCLFRADTVRIKCLEQHLVHSSISTILPTVEIAILKISLVLKT